MAAMTHRWLRKLLFILVIVGLVVILWPKRIDQAQPLHDSPDAPDLGVFQATEPDTLTAAASTLDSEPTISVEKGSLLTERAMNAWRSGDISGAMTLFEQAIDTDSDDPEPHTQYGRLLTLMVSYEKALPMLQRARDLRPDDAQAWLDLATLYERRQNLEKSWAAQAMAGKLVGSEAITRDEQGRFMVAGHSLW